MELSVVGCFSRSIMSGLQLLWSKMKDTGRNVAKQSGIFVIYRSMAITGSECFLKKLSKVDVILCYTARYIICLINLVPVLFSKLVHGDVLVLLSIAT